MELPQLIYTRTTEESRAINEDSRPGIIISASGMCNSGRILHHLKHHLWREDSHIVIIGFQAEGTIGRRLVDGAKTVRLLGEEIAVKAHIHTLGGFSAHADQKGLLDWLSHFKSPDLEVMVNHGEEKTSLGLAEMIQQRFHLKTAVPRWREKRTLFGSRELGSAGKGCQPPRRKRKGYLLRNPSPFSSDISTGTIRSSARKSGEGSRQARPCRIPAG